MKLLLTRYLLAAIATTFSTVSNVVAFTPDPTHVYIIVNQRSQEALEIGGSNHSSTPHNVNSWGYWGGAHQQWIFEPQGNGNYFIVNRETKDILRIVNYSNYPKEVNSQYVAQSTRAEIAQSTNPQSNQWFFEETAPSTNPSNATVLIRNRYYSGYCMENLTNDQKRNERYFVAPAAADRYTWMYQSLTSSTSGYGYITSEVYNIIDVSVNTTGQWERSVFQITNRNSNQALSSTEDRNGEPDNGVNQQVYRGLAGQEWTFTDYNQDGYLYIMNRETAQALEIGGNGDLTANGRTANLWNTSGSYNQQWAIYDLQGNKLSLQQALNGQYIRITNRNSGKVLEIGDGSTDERRSVQQWDWNATRLPWQQWFASYNSANRTSYPITNPVAPLPSQTVQPSFNTATIASSPTQTVELYPNPTSSVLIVSLPADTKVHKVQVTDALGKRKESHYLGNGKIDVSDLAAGFYTITILYNQQEYRQKFLKE